MKFWKFKQEKNYKDTRKEPFKPKSLVNHYKYFTVFFTVSFLLISFSPLVVGRTYDYVHSEIGNVQQLANRTPVELVNSEWNPDTGLFRVDLRVSGDGTTISNVQIKNSLSAYENDPKAKVDTEIIDVSPNYKIILSSKVPKGFEVLAVGLDPEYIEPEIESDAEAMENRKIQYYFYEGEVKINNQLEVESFNSYRVDWIDLRQKELAEQIAESKEDIRLNKVRIENIKQTIQDNEMNEEFMTEEEISEYNSEKSLMEDDIRRIEEEIKTQEENIETYESRNKLYEEEKESIIANDSNAEEN